MQLFLRPVVERGRRYAFPAAWLAIVASGVGLSEPLPNVDAAPYLSFAAIGAASAASSDQPVFLALDDKPAALTFVRHEPGEPEDWPHFATREASLGHGRFAAPGNAVRRQVHLRPVSPRTADELAGFFRAAAYTLTDVRLGEAVPPIKVDRVPGDLGTKGGLKCDARGQVLDGENKPITGLLAAGNASGSPFGNCYPGAGGTIGPAMVFGYLAANTIAARASNMPPAEERVLGQGLP